MNPLLNVHLIIFLLICKQSNATLYKHYAKKFVLLKGKSGNLTVLNVENKERLGYPGQNVALREKIGKMWEVYYRCLDDKANDVPKPEIHRLVEGQYIEFRCSICPKPFQDYQELQWKYRPLSPESSATEFENLDPTSQMELTNDMTLKIFNAMEAISGQYGCYQGQSLVSIYILEISKTDVIERVEIPNARHMDSIKFDGADFQTYYKWTRWTECSFCGNVGRKYKYGMCFVSQKKQKHITNKSKMRNLNRVRKDASNSTCPSDFIKEIIFGNGRNNINPPGPNNENVLQLMQVLEKTKGGVPCSWSFLTRLGFNSTIQRKPAVKAVAKRCQVDCPDFEIFEVFDNCGKLIEIANNSAGIYSSFQKIPQPPPGIERISVTANFGTAITIQCPSTQHKNIPVTWKVNKKIIFPDIIANESNGRFTIDMVNRIHITKLRLRDDRIYSCWQRNQLVGTVRLNVEKKLKITFDHHMTLLLMVILIGFLLILGFKIISRELNKRKV